jgi:hypothetical protein
VFTVHFLQEESSEAKLTSWRELLWTFEHAVRVPVNQDEYTKVLELALRTCQRVGSVNTIL